MKKIVAKTGTYINAQGEQKNRYQDIGVIMSNDNGEYILLNPAIDLAGIMIQQNLMGEPKGNVMCSIFDSQQQTQQHPQTPQQSYQQPAPPQQPQQSYQQPPQGYQQP